METAPNPTPHKAPKPNAPKLGYSKWDHLFDGRRHRIDADLWLTIRQAAHRRGFSLETTRDPFSKQHRFIVAGARVQRADGRYRRA